MTAAKRKTRFVARLAELVALALLLAVFLHGGSAAAHTAAATAALPETRVRAVDILAGDHDRGLVDLSPQTHRGIGDAYDESASGSPVAPKGVSRPNVKDPKLKNLVNDLYKGAQSKKPIGTGSTADAVRHEGTTGHAVGGRFHTQKATEYTRALEKWLKRNPNASAADRSAAQSILKDLRNALRGN